MPEPSFIALLPLGISLGVLHAFDADHILAVSTLAHRRCKASDGIVYALKWSLGHGGVLVLIAGALVLSNWQIPLFIAHSAEKLVGVILIFAGISLLWSFRQSKLRLQAHRHGNQLHVHLIKEGDLSHHDHSPTLVGIVHGVAGSAPALALIPASQSNEPLAIAYILVFSLGMLAGMASFGMLLGRTQQWILNTNPALFKGSRLLLGCCTTGLGVLWLTY